MSRNYKGRSDSGASVVFACITEPTKKFLDQSARLLMSLRWFGGSLSRARFVLGTTGPIPSEAARLFHQYGADTVVIPRYSSVHGPSNKIPLLRSPALAGHDVVALLDCDTVIVRDVAPWLKVSGVAAKIADVPSVTLAQLRAAFKHFGRKMPPVKFEHELTGDATIEYCNSGVIVVRETARAGLAEAWDTWNRRLLDAPESLAFTRYHVDQLSLAIAIEASGTPFEPLPAEMNMPTHLERKMYPPSWNERDPAIIHYHWNAYANGFLKPSFLRGCSARIEAFNARLRAEKLAASAPAVIGAPRRSAAKPKVVVGSGWWCDDTRREWTIGDMSTRSIPFFDVWHRQVVKSLAPHRIVITDSASPAKPDYRSFADLQWIELDHNYGHANDIRLGKSKTKYSGFTRSVLNGAMYALSCDADFYVYVEQDCLVFGDDLLAHALGDSTADILLGQPAENAKGLNGAVASPMLQQSLMIVRRAGLERFLEGLLGAPWTDGECSPEETMRKRLAPFDFVRIPFGRSRPLDFRQKHFYVQHLERDELSRALEISGMSLPDPDSVFFAGPERSPGPPPRGKRGPTQAK